MIDIRKIPKVARNFISGLLRREASANSPYGDGLEPVPDDVLDQLRYRIARGEYQPDRPGGGAALPPGRAHRRELASHVARRPLSLRRQICRPGALCRGPTPSARRTDRALRLHSIH